MVDFRPISLIAATLATGLIAGLFYAYSCSVMIALRQTDDKTFIDVMQRINVAILNGWFMLSFLGALVLTALAAVLYFRGGSPILWWVVAALVLYIVTMLVTMGVNVPLNNQLADAGDPSKIVDLAGVRAQFETAWVNWNLVRTLTSTAAFGCLAWALVLSGRSSVPSGA